MEQLQRNLIFKKYQQVFLLKIKKIGQIKFILLTFQLFIRIFKFWKIFLDLKSFRW